MDIYSATITHKHMGRIIIDVVTFADYEQALAEKDREIADLQDKYEGAKLQKDSTMKAYQQLMEQAIQFGECLTDDCRCTPEEVNTSSECAFVRAQAFLKSPEVQAWKERQQ